MILGSFGRLQIYLQDEGGKLHRRHGSKVSKMFELFLCGFALFERHVLDGFNGDVVPLAADWDGDAGLP